MVRIFRVVSFAQFPKDFLVIALPYRYWAILPPCTFFLLQELLPYRVAQILPQEKDVFRAVSSVLIV